MENTTENIIHNVQNAIYLCNTILNPTSPTMASNQQNSFQNNSSNYVFSNKNDFKSNINDDDNLYSFDTYKQQACYATSPKELGQNPQSIFSHSKNETINSLQPFNQELSKNNISGGALQTEDDILQLEKEFIEESNSNQQVQNSCIFKERTLIFVDQKELIQQRNETYEDKISRQSRIDLGGYDFNFEQRFRHCIYNFIIKQKLGSGKFSDVYIAIDKQTRFCVALKQIKFTTIVEFNLYQDIANEIIMQSKLKHKNIIQLYGFFITYDSIYLIQELACGKELFKDLKAQHNKSYNESIVALYIRQIADAVHYMHMCGIVHRDIKPENIMICDGILKLCDFGYAAPFGKLKMRSTFCGTLEYVSPEMIENKKYNNSVDVWSLGVLTYELIFGRSPFSGKDYEDTFKNVLKGNISFNSPISFECGEFINRLLVQDPLQRMKLAQALKHPFIANTNNSACNNNKQVDKTINVQDFEFLNY